MDNGNEDNPVILENESGDGAEQDFAGAFTNPSPRLKEGLNVKEFLQNRSGYFEIDSEEKEDNLFDDDADGTTQELDESSFYLKEFFKNPQQQKEILMQSITTEELTGDFEDLVPKMTSITADDQVKKLIVRPGNGKLVPSNGKVFYHYISFAEGKDGPFDSSIQRKKVEQIMLNQGACIPGLEIALKSMEHAEVAKFWIHYDLCWGKLGIPPRIPSESHCLFIVELLDSVDAEKLKSIHFMSREDRALLSFDEVYEGANEMKRAGNEVYGNGSYHDAVKKYRKGIEYLESFSTVNYEEDKKRTELLFVLYTNIAQCYLKSNIPAKACTACRLALKLPKHELAYKAYYRFAQAKFQLGNIDEAQKLCKRAVQEAPQQKNIGDIRGFLYKIEEALKMEDKGLTSMYQKMFIGSASAAKKENGSGDCQPSGSKSNGHDGN